MTAAEEGHSQKVPLSFLQQGRYRATVWEDGASANDVRRSERTVTSRDVLTLNLSAAGGAAVILNHMR
jgi:alpha-glucosidase